MTVTQDEPAAPHRASKWATFKLFIVATKHRDTALCFVLPLAFFVASFIVARVAAPDFASTDADYSSFFSTVAQMIVAVLIALAFDLGKLPPEQINLRRFVVGFSLAYIALGAAAAAIGLLPGLSPTFDRWIFAAALASAGSALLSVLTLSYQVVKGETEDAIS